MNQLVLRIGKASLAYGVLVVAAFFILKSWPAAFGWAAIGFFAFAYAINSFKEIVINKVVLQTYLDQMEALRQQMVVTVPCSFCSKLNTVLIRTNERNEFKCEHCSKDNLLIVNVSTAQITAPIAGVSFTTEQKTE